jgi:hypothetical protein
MFIIVIMNFVVVIISSSQTFEKWLLAGPTTNSTCPVGEAQGIVRDYLVTTFLLLHLLPISQQKYFFFKFKIQISHQKKKKNI